MDAATALDVAGHALTLGLAGTIVYKLNDGSLFSWHPMLMSVGFLALMAQGIMRAIDFRRVTGEARTSRIFTHSALQNLGIVCSLGGFAAIYMNKNKLGYPHFVSPHAKVGLAAVILAVGASVGGAFAFKRLGLFDLLPRSVQGVIKQRHRQFGFVTFLLGLVVAFFGVSYPNMNKGAYTTAWQAGIVALGLVVVGKGIVADQAGGAVKAK